MTLFKQYFRVQRSGLLIWVGFNGFLGWVLGASAKGMEATNALSGFLSRVMEKLPSSVQAFLGLAPGVSAIDNLIQAKIGFWMAIALPIYGCLMATASISREIDRGTADFLFALPVERQHVIAARWSVMAVNLITVALTTWASVCAGMAIGGADGNFKGYFWMIAQAAFVGVAMGSLALLSSLWASDYEKATKRALAGTGILFGLDMAMEMDAIPKAARFFNPYTYFDTVRPLLSSGPAWGDSAALAMMSVVALWLAMRQFRSRQIET